MHKRLLIIADVDNWCFAGRAAALKKHAPDDWKVQVACCRSGKDLMAIPFETHDVVFCLPTHYVSLLRRLFIVNDIRTPLVASHNSGVGRRWDWLLESLLSADYTIVNNFAAWNVAKSVIPRKKFAAGNISNGVDIGTFHDWREKRNPKSVVWVSSEQKLPHEHPGPGRCDVTTDVKGYWSILRPLKTLLENTGWEVTYIISGEDNAFSAEQMAEIYNRNTFALCASHAEGTPNYMLEAMACGCIPVTRPVGNMTEIICNGENGHIVDADRMRPYWLALRNAFDRGECDTMRRMIAQDMRSWDWEFRAPYFFAVFDNLAAGNVPQPFTYLTVPLQAEQPNDRMERSKTTA